MGFFRPTFAEIDLKALRHNYQAAQGIIPEGTGIMAMVKADAYGHGAVEISKSLESCGARSFGVATVEEGIELREAGIRAPVIVMGGLMGMGSPASGMMVGANLTPVVHSADVLEFLEAVSRAANKVIDVHLKIDTGMGRLGVLPQSLPSVLNMLKECKHLNLAGVMTHFAEAEDEEYTAHQMKVFEDALREITAAIGPVKLIHMDNSRAIQDGRHLKMTNGSEVWVRPGIMLYGCHQMQHFGSRRLQPAQITHPKGCGYRVDDNQDGNPTELRPVMSLKSAIALAKTVPESTNVSYGCTFTTKRKSRLGVIPIGYADGYPWSLSNKASVLVGGRRVPVIGRVTMDMIVVDLTDLMNVHVGDEVVLMGRQGEEEITVSELADLAGSIPYEIFCGISKRMPRVYLA